MQENFFKQVNLKKENIFFPNGLAKNLAKECQNYEKAIKQAGGIDLTVLGIGRDGHLAFNEPGSSFTSKTRVVNLALSTRRDNAKFFNKHLKQVPKKAITMGCGIIMQAKEIILIVAGKEKSKIVAKSLTGKISRAVPASILQKHPRAIIILDKEAAGKLEIKKLGN